jgi:hypothetical protein
MSKTAKIVLAVVAVVVVVVAAVKLGDKTPAPVIPKSSQQG